MREVLQEDFWYLSPEQLGVMEKFCKDFVDPQFESGDNAHALFLGVVSVFEKPKLLLAIRECTDFARNEAGRYSVATTDGDESCVWQTMSVHELQPHNYRLGMRCGEVIMSMTVFFNEKSIADADWRDGPDWATGTIPKNLGQFLS